ncbi:LysR family transcriptional regulator [Stenotrophomonas sp. CC120223-11]|uniref:LysR family transcriptional regulator n=1 Tax=unclassified Stenotrophomonas TaxID=196198 RepID=UPI000BD82B0A|nr:LysR family transcriptional regulator [Stenotrophomonas sp. CC120223-11]SNY56604.1 DNA-binding transcriptional regulator, LysR family [Stenotrophomonas sp. CC120223-11]
MKHFPWDNLIVLLAVIRGGTLREAAKAARMSTATLSRRLDALEERLGGKVVERTSTGCVPTELGQRVFALAEQMEEAADEIARQVDTPRELVGTVRINADEWASFMLITLLPGLNRQHPSLDVEVLTSREPYNLARREADALLRYGPPDTGDLRGDRVGQMDYALYANQAYAARRQAAIASQAWHELEFVGLDEPRVEFEVERWMRSLPGANRPWLRCNYSVGVLDGVTSGAGLGVVECAVAQHVGGLIRVRDAPALSKEVWLWTHRSLYDTPRFQALRDFLKQTWLSGKTGRQRTAK